MAKAFQWFGICKVGAQRRWLKRQGVQKVVLAGKLFKHEILFQRFGWMRHLPDLECLQIFTPHLIRKTSDASDNSWGPSFATSRKKECRLCPEPMWPLNCWLPMAC